MCGSTTDMRCHTVLLLEGMLSVRLLFVYFGYMVQ
jgi:hypothetical protein